MKPLVPRNKRGPEHVIQDDIITMLKNYNWFIKVTNGNAFQSGFPDLYATHSKYGARWIEVKLKDMKGSKFTSAQLEDFPKFVANGSGIWILTEATESEYQKLFKPCNWFWYLGVMK